MTIQEYGQEGLDLAYRDIYHVRVPTPVRELPMVMAWGGGYFMIHKAVLETSYGDVEVYGGVHEGKSDVYFWSLVVQLIKSIEN